MAHKENQWNKNQVISVCKRPLSSTSLKVCVQYWIIYIYLSKIDAIRATAVQPGMWLIGKQINKDRFTTKSTLLHTGRDWEA